MMENLAGVVSRYVSFACIGQECIFFNNISNIFNNISALQAATLYDICLTDCEEAVLVAGDVIVNTPAAKKNYMECYETLFQHKYSE